MNWKIIVPVNQQKKNYHCVMRRQITFRMQHIKEEHQQISTILSFSLIPLSGFATDIYIPSLPSMAAHLHANNGAVQLTLVLFMISAGLSQLFVGSLLDSFGRFRLGMAALAAFTLASIAIAL